MKVKIFFILSVITLFLFASVKVMARNIALPNGKIIYAIGSGLYSIDLATKNVKKIYQVTKGEINTVNQLSFGWLLLGINDAEKGDIIAQLNVKTKEEKLIGKGVSPVYMPEYHKILFSILNGIYVADINNFDKQRRLAKQCNFDNVPIFPISKKEAVFVTHDCDGNVSTWSYNVEKNDLELLPLKNCTPLLWRDKTKQLICAGEKQKYFLTDLNGENIKELPLGRGTHPVLYLPDTDQLILFVSEIKWLLGETHNLWLYNFKTGKKELISKNNGFAPGAGIYLPERD